MDRRALLQLSIGALLVPIVPRLDDERAEFRRKWEAKLRQVALQLRDLDRMPRLELIGELKTAHEWALFGEMNRVVEALEQSDRWLAMLFERVPAPHLIATGYDHDWTKVFASYEPPLPGRKQDLGTWPHSTLLSRLSFEPW
jgi:hypothetical protein